MINKDNIEEYFFDYFEGGLNGEEKKAVETFVAENKEFQVDFDAWGNSYLPEEEFTFDRVDELLVNTSGAKPGFFTKWKGAFLMLAVGVGVSGALFINVDSDASDDVLAVKETKTNTADQNSKLKDSKLKESDQEFVNASNKKSSENLVVGQNNDDSSDILENNVSHSDVVKTGESNSLKNNNDNKESGSNRKVNSAVNNSVVTGGVKTANSNTKIAVAENSPLTPSLASTNKGVSKTNIASKQNRGISNSSSNTKSSINKSIATANQKNVSTVHGEQYLQQVDVAMESSGVESLLSSPTLKKGRAKLEKYSKNVVKFTNDKNPYLILPNAVAVGINPSFAGNTKGIRASYVYSLQWPELADNYTGHIVSIDSYVKALRGGVGVMLESDVMGHNKFATKSVTVMYSPKIKLIGNTSIEPSLKYGYVQKSISWNQVKGNSLVDPRTGWLNVQEANVPEGVTSSSDGYSNIGGGLLVNTSKMYFGISYDHISNPTYQFQEFTGEQNTTGKLFAQVGGSIVPIKEYSFFVLSPSVHYVKVGGWDNLWLSNVIEVSSLFIGTSFSTSKDALFSVGYNNKNLRVNYLFGLARPAVAQAGHFTTHQVGLTFHFLPKK